MLCNGYVFFGETQAKSLKIGDRLAITAYKGAYNADKTEQKYDDHNRFQFDLLDENKKFVSSIDSISSDNENKGEINMLIPFNIPDESTSLTKVYYLVETKDNNSLYSHDDTVYQITLHGQDEVVAESVMDVKIYADQIKNVTILKGQWNSEGEFEQKEDITNKCHINLNSDAAHAKTLLVNGDAFSNYIKSGNLLLTKTSIGNTTPDNAVFIIKDSNGQIAKEVQYSSFENGTYTVENLTIGTYTIEEDDADIDGYKLNVTGNQQSLEIDENKTTSVEIVNTYEKVGNLTIKKY